MVVGFAYSKDCMLRLPPFQRSQHVVRSHRNIWHADADGIRYRVSNRRANRNRGRLAKADNAAVVVLLANVHVHDDVPNIGDARQFVPLHIGIERPAGLVIDHALFEQGGAAAHVMLLPGVPFTRMLPSTASSWSGSTPSVGATVSKSFASAFTVDFRVEVETPPTVVEPPDPPSGGRSFVPMTSFTWPICKPSVSAATCVMMVRVPVPRSCVPISIETVPSGLITVRHWLG